MVIYFDNDGQFTRVGGGKRVYKVKWILRADVQLVLDNSDKTATFWDDKNLVVMSQNLKKIYSILTFRNRFQNKSHNNSTGCLGI